MNKRFKGLAALSTLAMLGVTGAQASIIVGNAAGGSEAILSFVNVAGDSISQDLGVQVAGLTANTNFSLSTAALNFISAAGGAANVTFGIIAGNTTTRDYLTSSGNATFVDDVLVGNGARSNWAGSLNGLITNLNQGDATPTSTNLTYGPFAAGSGTSNYLDGLYDTWASGDFALSNLTPGNTALYLYNVVFSTASIGFAPIGALDLSVTLGGSQISIDSTSAVPAPAAVWLLGTALVPLARRSWKKSRTAA